MGCLPTEDHFADVWVLEQYEPAESDQREQEVVDNGDCPSDDHRCDASGLSKWPSPEDIVHGIQGNDDEAKEKVAKCQVEDVEICRVL